jgi:hypothetical protein
MDPGVYTLTVSNPGGESDDLPNAFTVTLSIGAWNAGKLYGGPVGFIARTMKGTLGIGSACW